MEPVDWNDDHAGIAAVRIIWLYDPRWPGRRTDRRQEYLDCDWLHFLAFWAALLRRHEHER
jgi:hypothetical protein